MGRDKALIAFDGRALALVAVDALEQAGASAVVCVGGDESGLRSLGLTVVTDGHPGEGPLGGLITALEAVEDELVVVLSCDLPHTCAAAVRSVVEAIEAAPGAEVAVPVTDGRRQFLHAAYRRRSLPLWRAAFAAGERSLHRATRPMVVVEVAGIDPRWVRDADTPEDLPGPPG